MLCEVEADGLGTFLILKHYFDNNAKWDDGSGVAKDRAARQTDMVPVITAAVGVGLIFVAAMYHHSAITQSHARLLARFNHTQISWWLAAKRALHLQPMTTICVTCGCHLLVVSYVHMTLERGLALPDGGDDDADDARARLTEFPQLLGDELVTALWIHLQAIRFAFVPPCTHGARALLVSAPLLWRPSYKPRADAGRR